jgi:hypothetical protein
MSSESGLFTSGEDVAIQMGRSIQHVTISMVNVAKILSSGEKYFRLKMDPNYMKNLSKNIISYTDLANHLTSKGGTKNILKSLVGIDPITQAANGMIKIAGAYDKLANALKKFGGALSSIDAKKVNMIKGLNGSLALNGAKPAAKEEDKGLFSKIFNTDKVSKVSVGVAKNNSSDKIPDSKVSKNGTLTQQMDILIDILNNINVSTKSVDSHLGTQADSLGGVVKIS